MIMFSKRQWRKACVFAWLVCHDRVAVAVEIIPLSLWSSTFPRAIHALTSRTSSNPNASCPVKGHVACGNGMADYFCCASDTTCMVIAFNTTAVCCPKGASCDTISTIICDITAQDVAKNPESPIHTTKLNKSLPQCGKQCCPFGYKCRGDAACVLENEVPQGSRTRSSTSITAGTKTETMASATEAAKTTTNRLPASATPSLSSIQDALTSSTTAASSQSTGTAAAAPSSSEKSTLGGIIAGTTVAAIASVAGLICLFWFKRRSISERTSSANFPRPWQPLREQDSEQDFSLPRYTSPPPAYNNSLEMKPHQQQQYAFKHYSPESVGQNVTPVELPATPVSFSAWGHHYGDGEMQRPQSRYEPYRRPD